MKQNGSIKKHQKSAANDLPRLIHALQHGSRGEIHLVVFDAEPTANLILKDLNTIANVAFKTLKYSPNAKITTFWNKISKGLKTSGMILTHLQAIPATESEDTYSPEDLLAFLNHRLLTADTLAHPVVIFLPIYFWEMFRTYAPDLWEHCTAFYLFESRDFDRFRREFYLIDFFADTQHYRFFSHKKCLLDLYEAILAADRQTPLHDRTLRMFSLLGKIAALHFKLGNLPAAYNFLKEQKKIYGYLKNEKLYPEILNNIGVLQLTAGKHREAEICFAHAWRTAEEQLRGANHPAKIIILTNQSTLSYELGDYTEAFVKSRKALRMGEAKMGMRHEALIPLLLNFAKTLRARNENEDALDHFRRALKIVENRLGIDHPYTSVILQHIGLTYYFQKKYELARRYVYRTLESMEQALGPEHPYMGLLFNNIGVTHFHEKNGELALKYYQWALEIRRKKMGPRDLTVGYIFSNAGKLHHRYHRIRQAQQCFRKALEILKLHLPPEHPEIQTIEQYLKTISHKTASEYES